MHGQQNFNERSFKVASTGRHNYHWSLGDNASNSGCSKEDFPPDVDLKHK